MKYQTQDHLLRDIVKRNGQENARKSSLRGETMMSDPMLLLVVLEQKSLSTIVKRS